MADRRSCDVMVLRFPLSQWMNGVQFTQHSGGHLPFEGDVTDLVHSDSPNTLTVAINNTLSPHTLPPGEPSTPKQYAYAWFLVQCTYAQCLHDDIHIRALAVV